MKRRGPDARLSQRLRAAIGLPRKIKVDGAVYRERSAEPLSRALSSRGSGSKDYEVKFKRGERILIHCTRTRQYADLVGDRTPTSVRAVEPMVRPGMRVLICPGGSGALADRVARLVGPSGAVVALDADEESVRFASKRYPWDNVAFEVGDTTGIGGETNGAFNAAVITLTSEDQESATRVVSESVRVVTDGGWLLLRSEGGRLDETARGAPADARSQLRRALAACERDGGRRFESSQWLEEPTGTPAVLLILQSKAPGDGVRG